MLDPSNTRLGRLGLLVALVAALVFARPAAENQLVYDAEFLVKHNGTFKEAAAKETLTERVLALNQIFKEEFWAGTNKTLDDTRKLRGQALYRPLMLYPMGLSFVLFGADPRPINFLNLLWHAAAALFVTKLALLLARDRRLALFAGLLFASHPLHAEAVAYGAGLGETQALAFGLLALLCYLRAFDGARIRAGRLAGAVVAFTIALFTKESAAIFVLLAVFADVARRNLPALASGAAALPPLRRRLLAYGLLAAVLAVNVAIRWQVCGRLDPDTSSLTRLDNPLAHEPFIARVATGAMLYAKALQLFVIPWPQSADYSFNQLPIAHSLAEPAALVAFLLCAAMTLAGFLALARNPALGFGLLLFLFSFGPVSNIPLPIGTIFGERLLYTPTAGLCLAAAALLVQLRRAAERRGEVVVRVLRTVMLVALIGLSVRAVARAGVYESNDRLYANMVETAPESARAYYQRGEMYRGRKDLSAAAQDFRRAIEILPEFLLARIQLAVAELENNQFKQALDAINGLLALLPPDNPAFDSFRTVARALQAQVYARGAGSEDPRVREESILEFIKLIEEEHARNPDDMATLLGLANIYLQRGQYQEVLDRVRPALLAHPDQDPLRAVEMQAIAKLGDVERAKELLEQLAGSENAEVKRVVSIYRGVLLTRGAEAALAAGDAAGAKAGYQAALEHFERHVTDYPQDPEGWYQRGYAYHDGFGRLDDAIKDYQQVIKLNPSHPDVYFRMSQCVVAMHKFDPMTERFLAEAETLYPDNASFLMGYASILAGSGKHELAVEKYQKAISLGMNSPGAHAFVAKEWVAAGKPDKAVEAMQEAERKYRVIHPEIALQWGIAEFERENYTAALEQFERGQRMCSEQPAEWGGNRPFLDFQHAKTLLRIPGRERSGYDDLAVRSDVLAQMALAAEQAGDSYTARNLSALRAFALRQMAWARLNVADLKDAAQAVELLEQACALAEANGDKGLLFTDLWPDLASAYESAGRAEEAAALRGKLTPKAPN